MTPSHLANQWLSANVKMRTVFVCCVLLTITISATSLAKSVGHQKFITDRRLHKNIIKRDASLLVDTSPIDIEPVYKVHPVIAFRRLSRSRQTSLPKQSSRLHKSSKKYRKKPTKPIYNPKFYRPGPKPKHYRKRIVTKNSNYPRPHKYLQQYSTQHEMGHSYDGFGEPPSDLISYSKNEYRTQSKPNFSNELIDSYGEPIKTKQIDNFPPVHPSKFNKDLDLQEIRKPGNHEEYATWSDLTAPESDNVHAFSKHRPRKEIPQPLEQTIDEDEIPKLNNYYMWNQDKPKYNVGKSKYVRMPWKQSSKKTKIEDEILVGGQYAEPPARYVPRFQPSAPLYDEVDEFLPSHRTIDSEVAASATRSPYVNYKHSNMAFSPQNLNDAFSIVENY